MRRFRYAVPVLIALFASATVSFAAFTTAYAHLSRGQEVAPCGADTVSQGQALFSLSDDGETLTYTLIVANIDAITMAHIHLGAEGTNGPVVVDLFIPSAPTGSVNGPVESGTITAEDLKGPLDVDTDLSRLVAALEAGTAYVNVHTTECPGGAIRGQIIVPDGQ